VRARLFLLAAALTLSAGAAADHHATPKDGSVELKKAKAERDALRLRVNDLEAKVTKLQATLDAMRKALSGQAAPAPAKTANRRKKTGRVYGKIKLPKGKSVAFVYVKDIQGPLVNRTVDIKQERGRYVPSWRLIRAGTSVDFPNEDSFYHHVFSATEGHEFDNGLYRAGERSKAHRFTKPGLVDIYCDIHEHMHAEVLVIPNGYFTRVKHDGSFSFDVPAGKRVVSVWGPGLIPMNKTLNVKRGGKASFNVDLSRPRGGSHKRIDGSGYKKK
jgi:plastocyanin